jgi:hypothetical protein
MHYFLLDPFHIVNITPTSAACQGIYFQRNRSRGHDELVEEFAISIGRVNKITDCFCC